MDELILFLKQLINGFQVGSIYALVALGYTMVYGIVKLINFAHGDFIMVGGYVAVFSIPFLASHGMPAWLCILLRLIVVPLLTLGGLLLCGIRDVPMVSCVVAASAPVAAASTMFATKFDQDVELSVNLVSISTLFSIVTMPLIVSVAQMLA